MLRMISCYENIFCHRFTFITGAAASLKLVHCVKRNRSTVALDTHCCLGLHRAYMGKGFHHVCPVESRLVRNMQKEGISWSQMKKITGRSRETINNILNPPKGVKKTITKGQPRKIKEADMKQILRSMERLQKEKHPKGKEVTADMILNAAGIKASERTLLREFHDRKIEFFRLKERQILMDDDIKKRKVWGAARKGRRKRTWVRKPHAIIDNKHWQLFTTGAGRSHAARRTIRGGYQKRGGQPEGHMVKPKGGNNKFPAKGVTVTAAVIKGRVRVWNYVDGAWNGQTAADMYRGPLVKAMRKAFPDHAKKPGAKWEVLEDNDPTGFKSSKARAAKKEVGIEEDELPRRSPDLNVLDYALWHEINVRMRKQESSWPSDKRESADEYKKRLRQTALGLPESFVSKCVGDMARRCNLLVKRRGKLFRE